VVFSLYLSAKRLPACRNSVTNRRGNESNKRVNFRQSQVTSSQHSIVFFTGRSAFGDFIVRGGILFEKIQGSGSLENHESLDGAFPLLARSMAGDGPRANCRRNVRRPGAPWRSGPTGRPRSSGPSRESPPSPRTSCGRSTSPGFPAAASLSG